MFNQTERLLKRLGANIDPKVKVREISSIERKLMRHCESNVF